MQWIALATEDELSEQVGLHLAHEAGFEVGECLRRGGNGYLRSRVANFCQMSQTLPVLLITDLDQARCASTLVKEWLGKKQKPASFMFRVAVREVESWLLADHDAMRALLGRKATKLPTAPDDLQDPKEALLRLALNAPRDVRDDLVVKQGSIASQGIGYNARLCGLVRDSWQAARAANRSPSLQRARIRLREFADSR
jgi:hypothetical protein